MEQNNHTAQREMKLTNGDAVIITEEEFQRVVEVFKMLRDTDRRIILEAVNGSKVNLVPLFPDNVRQHIGKKIWVAIQVKEELQGQNWDFYYKLERVTLDGVDRNTKLLIVKTLNNWELKIETRGVFLENAESR